MKINPPTWRSLRVPITGLAASALAISGVSIAGLATRPASSSSPQPQAVEFIEPTSDEETTTTTAAPVTVVEKKADDSVAVRAEEAAARAETAAGRAEVARTKVEEIVASTTTTTTTAEPSTSTTTGQPVLVDVSPPSTSSTTTTTAPKAWVVVARFPVVSYGPTTEPPLMAKVELMTGRLRVSGLPSPNPMYGIPNITVTETCSFWPSPVQRVGTFEFGDDCPTGPATITAARSHNGTQVAPYGAKTAVEIVVEEYR